MHSKYTRWLADRPDRLAGMHTLDVFLEVTHNMTDSHPIRLHTDNSHTIFFAFAPVAVSFLCALCNVRVCMEICMKI